MSWADRSLDSSFWTIELSRGTHLKVSGCDLPVLLQNNFTKDTAFHEGDWKSIIIDSKVQYSV